MSEFQTYLPRLVRCRNVHVWNNPTDNAVFTPSDTAVQALLVLASTKAKPMLPTRREWWDIPFLVRVAPSQGSAASIVIMRTARTRFAVRLLVMESSWATRLFYLQHVLVEPVKAPFRASAVSVAILASVRCTLVHARQGVSLFNNPPRRM